MKSYEKLHIATIGKCVGLYGDLKLHLHTDFHEQFKAGASFEIAKDKSVTIQKYDQAKSLVRFEGYGDRNSASSLTNQKLFTTLEKTYQECVLNEGEYFWFEMIGAEVYEGKQLLGEVEEIQRIASTDYLVVKTDRALLKEEEKKLPKRFMVPYIPVYIDTFERESKKIFTHGAYDILEAS